MQTNANQIKIRKSIAKSMLEASEGTFVGLTFRKKDGSVRELNGRLGVRKGTKGGRSNLSRQDYLTVYDVKRKGFRAVNLATLTRVRMRGFEYDLEEVAQ